MENAKRKLEHITTFAASGMNIKDNKMEKKNHERDIRNVVKVVMCWKKACAL